MSIEELYKYCSENNIDLPENSKNKRYVIRAIEKNGVQVSRRNEPIENTIIIGISTDRDVLRDQISKRAEQMFDDNVVNEAKLLGKKYGWNSEAMTSNIYPLIHLYLEKEISLEEAKIKSVTLDWKLAKRQLTWLRRNKFIKWLTSDQAETYIVKRLAKLV